MSDFRRTAARLRYRAKHGLGRRPRLYHWVSRLRGGTADRLVTDATDLCIEGFPRSANSFAVGAFEHAQDRSYTIAHHNHVPAPILNAVRRGLPTIVLIRDPVDAVVSGRALHLQNRVRAGDDAPAPRLPYAVRLRAWVGFYETVWPVRDDIVVAPFEVVTSDFGDVIAATNERFGTAFARFEHTAENVDTIRSRGYHALPSDERDRLKQRARTAFAEEVGADHPRVRAARALYERVADTAPA
jgi:hypothetical protein